MNSSFKILRFFIYGISIALSPLVTIAAVDADPARLLIKRNAEFHKEIIKVSESVYTAVGYAVSMDLGQVFYGALQGIMIFIQIVGRNLSKK